MSIVIDENPTIVIRKAEASDIPQIVEMGSRSLKDGPYSGIIKDNPDQTTLLAAEVIKKSTVLVAEQAAELIGIMAFILFPHYFTGVLTAGELIWYVKPERRTGGTGLKLMWAAERLAKEMGAKQMQVTSPTKEVSALYSRYGYREIETTYMRNL